MHFIIYKITNKVNGKIYIGKHKCKRLDDNYFGSGKLLKYAIQKYGKQNFEMTIEIDLKSQEEMDLLEELVVNKDFLQREDVYNISRGGKNPCMYGKTNPFFGKTHSEKTLKKISTANKGKIMSVESRRHISESLKKLYQDEPERRAACATNKNKIKCRFKQTGEILFIDKNDFSNDYELYRNRKDRHVSKERKLETSRRRSNRSKNSGWFNNGIKEIFCLLTDIPAGFIKGRLPGLNKGRKYSNETLLKMRNAKLGKHASNKDQIFITNGIENKYISRNMPIPNGWRHGMTRNKKKNT